MYELRDRAIILQRVNLKVVSFLVYNTGQEFMPLVQRLPAVVMQYQALTSSIRRACIGLSLGDNLSVVWRVKPSLTS